MSGRGGTVGRAEGCPASGGLPPCGRGAIGAPGVSPGREPGRGAAGRAGMGAPGTLPDSPCGGVWLDGPPGATTCVGGVGRCESPGGLAAGGRGGAGAPGVDAEGGAGAPGIGAAGIAEDDGAPGIPRVATSPPPADAADRAGGAVARGGCGRNVGADPGVDGSGWRGPCAEPSRGGASGSGRAGIATLRDGPLGGTTGIPVEGGAKGG